MSRETRIKGTEAMLVLLLALGPPSILVVMVQYYGAFGIICALVFSGFYLLLVLIGMTMHHRMRRDDDQRLAEEGSHSQLDSEEDLPPSYEVVTAKPPPYALLYTPEQLSDALAPVHKSDGAWCVPVHLTKSDRAEWMSGDDVIPTYDEATRVDSPAPATTTPAASSLLTSLPPTPPPARSTPPTRSVRAPTPHPRRPQWHPSPRDVSGLSNLPT